MDVQALRGKIVGMKRWQKALSIATLGFFAVTISGVLAANAYLRQDRIKDMVAEAASSSLGRTVQINGDLSLGFSMTPTVVASNVVLENADWGTNPTMAKVKRFEMKLALEPLLEGKADVSRLVLINPDILLETSAKGVSNWELSPIEDMGIELAAASKAERAYEGLQLALASRDGNVDEGYFGNKSLSLNVSRIDVKRIEIKGGRLVYRNGVDKVKMVLPVSKMTAGLTHENGLLVLTGLDGQVGSTTLKGELRIATEGKRPHVAGTLTTGNLTVKDFLPKSGLGTKKKVAAVATNSDRLISAQKFNLNWLRIFDADVKVTAKRLNTETLTLANVKANVKLQHGKLTLRPAKAKLADGGVVISAWIDARKSSNLRMAAEVEVKKLNAGALLDSMGLKGLIKGGQTDARFRLTAAGNTPRALMASLDGEALMVVGAGQIDQNAVDLEGADHLLAALHNLNGAGSILSGGSKEMSILLGGAKIMSEVFQAIDAQDEGVKSTNLRCAVINVPFKSGVMSSKSGIAVETDANTVVASGTVDFNTENLDMTLMPQNENMLGLNIAPLADPLRISGTFMKPDVGVNGDSLAMSVASFGLALATGGASVMLETAAGLAMADDNPCQTALVG